MAPFDEDFYKTLKNGVKFFIAFKKFPHKTNQSF